MPVVKGRGREQTIDVLRDKKAVADYRLRWAWCLREQFTGDLKQQERFCRCTLSQRSSLPDKTK